MNVEVVVKADDKLQNLITRALDLLEGHSPVKPVPTKEEASAVVGTEPMGFFITQDAKEDKALHYGRKEDGTIYTKWTDMTKALDKAGEEKAKEVLAKYSENGTYGGVKPADWDKVIKACNEKKDKPAEPVKEATAYAPEDVRALARKVQLEKGKETLHAVFKEFGKTKFSDFDSSDYPLLYDKLSKEMA